jgi:hypothetical protein
MELAKPSRPDNWRKGLCVPSSSAWVDVVEQGLRTSPNCDSADCPDSVWVLPLNTVRGLASRPRGSGRKKEGAPGRNVALTGTRQFRRR